jgi:enoyl-CoA hydratase/carnithine racemase
MELASGKLLRDVPSEHVLRLTISNEEKRGALDHELLDALADAVSAPDARCVILRGSGKMFSAGYDIGDFEADDFEREAEQLVAHPFAAAIEALETCPIPTIAQINGHAIGGGLEVAVTCDMRFAADGVKLGMPPAKLGLIYSHTGLRKFIEVCGVGATSELFYVGRNIDADRACSIGLVNQVVEPDELDAAALDMAAEIGANSPLSLAGNKEIMRTLRAYGISLPEEVARRMVRLRESCFTSGDFVEGIRAFAEKRPPRWKGR